LAVAAVSREPVSGLEFPANREKYREFARMAGIRRRFEAEFGTWFRALGREFPADGNREFFEAEQGINSRDQGIRSGEQGTEKGYSLAPIFRGGRDSMSP
jgi:hypothetical protein